MPDLRHKFGFVLWITGVCTVVGCGKPSASRLPVEVERPPMAASETGEPDFAGGELKRFESTQALAEYITGLDVKRERQQNEGYSVELAEPAEESPAYDDAVAGEALAPSPPPMPSNAQPSKKSSEEDSITNNQEIGVDEGGIVKAHRGMLVVLRRGRLFTAKLQDGSMQALSALDVRPYSGHDAWYDEMLIHDDTIVVIGFSYEVGATEIGLFELGRRGELHHRETYFLRSNDYYSSRNYASRLIGDRLVFYTPVELYGRASNESVILPSVGRWKQNHADDWEEVIEASQIYRPIEDTYDPILHTVVSCDLSRGAMSCTAQGIVGPRSRSFYVSPQAVYVWSHEGAGAEQGDPDAPPGVVYRLPFDHGRVGALKAWGAPTDQFSFQEHAGHLNVLVRSESSGEGMWSAEHSSGDVALMRVPLEAFDYGVLRAKPAAYIDLPEPDGQSGEFHNRFVGDHVLYGMRSWNAHDESDGAVWVYSTEGRNTDAARLSLPHGVERLEALGRDALVVGSNDRGLHFTALDLSARPTLAGSYVARFADQAEQRSHGFFYKEHEPGSGVLGLPVRGRAPNHPSAYVQESSEVMFLAVDQLNFRSLGALVSDPRANRDDQCQVSCTDWYGNARPIFYRDRVFALMGYELVEGGIDQGRMHEMRRINLLDALENPRHDGPIWKGQ